MSIIERMHGLPLFIQFVLLIYNEVFLLTMIISMQVEVEYDNRHSELKNIAVPYTFELIVLYCLAFLYNGFDIILLYFEGFRDTVADITVRVGMVGYYAVGAMLTLFFLGVVRRYLAVNMNPIVAKITVALQVSQVLLLVLLAISQFTDFLYGFDENNYYYRANGYLVWHVVTDIAFIFIALMIIRQWNEIDDFLRQIMITGVPIPLLGFCLGLSLDGVDFNNIAVMLAAFIMFIMHQRYRSLYMMDRAREHAEVHSKLMLSQIGPHFLYNTLTSIVYYVDKEPETAKKALLDFSNYLRANIRSIESIRPIPFDEELQHVRKYLSLEQLRFSDKLSVEYNITDNDFSLPALTVQPLAENAVRHGIRKNDRGIGTIHISTCSDDENHVVEIRDDGCGFDTDILEDAGDGHVGIRNVRSRLASMVNGSLVIESEKGAGTLCRIIIPRKH